MDETLPTPASEPIPETTEPPDTGLPDELVRLMLEEWQMDPALVEWIQRIAADAPAEAMGYFAASAGAGLLATFLGLIIPLVLFTVTYLVIAGIFAFLIWLPHRKVPRKYRRISGFSIWLTIIPFFGLLWNFRVVSRVPATFRNYFLAHPEAAQPPPGMVGGAPLNVGGAGKALGMWYAGLSLASWLTLLTCVLSPLSTPLSIAAIVLYILFVVKLFQMSGRIAEFLKTPPAAPPSSPTPAPPVSTTS
ncbi:MAG: hypothetical protein AAF328_06335 [Planctomycetota bacterium]